MVRKIPGFYFTGDHKAGVFCKGLISEPQYRAILEDIFDKMPEAREKYNKLVKDYNFSYGVPKYKLYVKLAPDTTWERREYISNGIRNYFRDDVTVLLDK